jgi:malonyl-CoA O-methyltransferase
MIDKEQVRKHFSRYAPHYDENAKVQKNMADILIQWVKSRQPFDCRNILDIGCGTGYVTSMLRDAFPQAAITAMDISPRMLEIASGKVHDGNICFICGDIEEALPGGPYQLIVSNATFQWLNNQGAVLKNIMNSLSPGGLFCFSTFGEKTFSEFHNAYSKAAEKLGIEDFHPSGQEFCDVSYFKNILKTRYSSFSFNEELVKENHKTVLDFLNSIKKIGASDSSAGRNPRYLELLKKAMQIYESEYRDSGNIPATYHCIYGFFEFLE